MASASGLPAKLRFPASAVLAGAVFTAALTWAVTGWQRTGPFGYLPWLLLIALIALFGGSGTAAAARLPHAFVSGTVGAAAAIAASRLALVLTPYDLSPNHSAFQPVATAAGALAYAAAAWAAAGAGGRRARIVTGGVTLAVLASMAVARVPVTEAYRVRVLDRLGVPSVITTVAGAPFRGVRVKWPRDASPGRGTPALRLEFAERKDDDAEYVRIDLWGHAAPDPATACRTVVDLDEHEDHETYTPCRRLAGDRWVRSADDGLKADVFTTRRGALVRVSGLHFPEEQLLTTAAGLCPVPPHYLARHWTEPNTSPLTGE